MTERKNEIPNSAIEALARCLLPAIRSYFESEEGRREYAEWKAQQDKNSSAITEKETLPLAS
ncbi:MAG: hypothetical protein FWH20_11435 [Oscillospiraceae bacterium]|nr:hypothetical protein [Oscillospiraceae bacterium]